MKPNARFWVWHGDGWVKLTLRHGQTLSTYRGGSHSEGCWSEFCSWTHEGDGVRYEHATDGTDCDGRLSSGAKAFCPLGQLKALESCEASGIFRPFWKWGQSSQRDYAAEACGY